MRPGDANILMVEDMQMAQKAARDIFDQLGSNADIVDWACQAFEKLVKKNYDIIFVDIHLPDINGLDFVRAVRATESGSKKIPIIGVTSAPSDKLKLKAKCSGCNELLSKPLNFNMIEKILSHY
jgi:CheY-like chemotaxis protein